MVVFDHLKLARRDPVEVKRLRTFLMEGRVGVMREIGTAHEADGSCCRLEPWELTFSRIGDAVNPPAPVLLINTGETP
jgi:hypothetical protein